jgi:hypothetical protein
LTEAKDPLGSRWVQPFGQCRQHYGDPAREGVFRRSKGVLRRALNVVWQAGQRSVWIRSAWPCLPSPTNA